MKCSRCETVLEATLTGAVKGHECPKCNGAWYEEDQLRQAKDTADIDLNWLDFELWTDWESLDLKAQDLSCPSCGGELEPAEHAPKVIHQVDIVEVPILIEEHRGLAFWCPSCQTIHYAPFPSTVAEGGLCGPRVTALVA